MKNSNCVSTVYEISSLSKLQRFSSLDLAEEYFWQNISIEEWIGRIVGFFVHLDFFAFLKVSSLIYFYRALMICFISSKFHLKVYFYKLICMKDETHNVSCRSLTNCFVFIFKIEEMGLRYNTRWIIIIYLFLFRRFLYSGR